MSSLLDEIKNGKSRVFRRAFIKRKDATTGLFESTWQTITSDVKRWGSIDYETDPFQPSNFRINNVMLQVANDSGRFNPEDDEASLWFGYASRQRSLFKVEAGFLHQTYGSNGIWTVTEFPTSSTLFVGILSGDIMSSEQNIVNLRIKPLTQVFEDFPARLITGYTTTGITASKFVELIRDQTDGAGSYIFRPFFGDTTSNWDIQTTTVTYSELNTSTSAELIDLSCWEVVKKLAESENFSPRISREGKFIFRSKDANTTTVQFQFYGRGFFNSDYGHTIKKIRSFGKKFSSYYSRVQIKFEDSDTVTSYTIVESTLTVSGTDNVWNFGHRTFSIENFWIPNTATALTIATALHSDLSQPKDEIEFETSFVPHLSVLDRISVSYDSTDIAARSRWDFNDWENEGTASSTSELYWDDSIGDNIRLDAEEFKALSVKIDLDQLSCTFKGRGV